MKFVIAVDGSKPSETAFTYVMGLAEKKVDELLLVTSVLEKKGLLSTATGTADEQHAKDFLSQYESRASTGWLSAYGKILRGDPRRTLPLFMKEASADVLVMGARGLGPLKRVLLGSVSSYVLQHSHSPVMVVKNTLPVAPRKFLYCYDGSEASKNALPFLLRLSKPGDSVFIVHVVQSLATYQQLVSRSGAAAAPASSTPSASSADGVDVPEETPEEQATIKHEMDAYAEEVKKHKLNALVLMEHGDPRDVVNKLLQRLNIDMAVAGSSGRSGVHWWSTGSFSTDLVLNAVCNAVLVVKPSHEPARHLSEFSESGP